MFTSQLTSTRSSHEKAQTSIFDEPVHLVQKFGHHLNLVDDDQPPVILIPLPEQSGADGILAEDIGLKKIEPHLRWVALSQPVCLPRLARPPQKRRSS